MELASPNHLEFDYLFKLFLIDDSSVVKSSHLFRFTSDFLDYAEVIAPTAGNDGEQAIGIRRLLVEATGLNQASLAHFVIAMLQIMDLQKGCSIGRLRCGYACPEKIFHGKGNIKEEAELTKEERKRRRANQKRRFRRLKARSYSYASYWLISCCLWTTSFIDYYLYYDISLFI
ncbi:hypothetical protein ZIOFF_063319 [Zingiber officinale]|uniref:Uncharacterized protein n=1 Tax=Zingiber officinale TaxID=94328 RepID=A0A8J5F631_ZINOF|nr:hypothetical protein ZIOFF_063319 [Zingiber officinale]